ncbi:MAG: hypothetical protein Kow0059_12790 [Candidatus Sumerlaeia bacterium]
MNRSSVFVCPACGGGLQSAPGALRCPSCVLDYPIIEGVPDFTGGNIEWGEFERSQAERLIERADEAGWRAAVREVLAGRPDLVEYILDERRANALALVPWARRGRLLDVGAGWGAISTQASRLFEHVFSIEAVRLRVQFTRRRVAAEGADNVTLAQASVFALPFPSEFFDVILLNGVLEWIGDWDRSRPPRAAQTALLGRLRGFLRPGGLLLVGIENRFGYRYFLGRRDHNGLPATSLLPRVLADAASRLMRRGPYRVYTYSPAGLERLTGESGFERPQMWAPLPGYNIPATIASLEGRGALAWYLARRRRSASGVRRLAAALAEVLNDCGAMRGLVPDLLAVARRPPPQGGDPAECPRSLWEEVQRSPEFTLPDDLGRAAACGVVVLGENGAARATLAVMGSAAARPAAFVKTAAPDLAPQLRAEHATLVQLESLRVQGVLPKIAPRSYGLREGRAGAVLVQEALAGDSLFDILVRSGAGDRAPARALDEAVELALALAGRTPPPDPPPPVEPHRRRWLEAMEEAAGRLRGRHPRPAALQAALGAVAGKVEGVGRLRFQHGDLFPKNIVRLGPDEPGGRFALVDWADAGWGLPPLFDLVMLFTTWWVGCGRGGVTPAFRLAHFDRVFWGDHPMRARMKGAFEHGRRLWELGDEWRLEEIVWVGLAVYAQRVRGVRGPDDAEQRTIEALLERAAIRLA